MFCVSQKRVNSFALLVIECQPVNTLPYNDVVDDFANTKVSSRNVWNNTMITEVEGLAICICCLCYTWSVTTLTLYRWYWCFLIFMSVRSVSLIVCAWRLSDSILLITNWLSTASDQLRQLSYSQKQIFLFLCANFMETYGKYVDGICR